MIRARALTKKENGRVHPHDVPGGLTCRQILSARAVTTRAALAHAGWHQSGTVSPELDRKMKVAPSDRLGEAGRGHKAEDLVVGVLGQCRAPFSRMEGADVMIRVPLPDVGFTTPRRGISSHALLILRRGVRAARTYTQNIPVRASGVEGAGMT